MSLCEYCHDGIGFWDDEAGDICRECLQERDAKKEQKRRKYETERSH
jgi:hypothetical protein